MMQKTVLITRPKAQAQDLAVALEACGFQCIIFPTIEIVPLTDWLSTLPSLPDYSAIFFTSANGVEHFVEPLRRVAPDFLAHIRRLPIYAVGEKTKARLLEAGFAVAAMPDKFSAAELAALLPKQEIAQRKFLFVCGKLSQRLLPEHICTLGGSCDEYQVYDTRLPENTEVEQLKTLLEKGKIDVIAFTSPSTVKNFFALLGGAALPAAIKLAAIGDTTAQAVRTLYGRVDIVPTQSTSESFAFAIAAAFQ